MPINPSLPGPFTAAGSKPAPSSVVVSFNVPSKKGEQHRDVFGPSMTRDAVQALLRDAIDPGGYFQRHDRTQGVIGELQNGLWIPPGKLPAQLVQRSRKSQVIEH